MNKKIQQGTKKVNHKLRAHRRAKFWSMRDAAEAIGVSVQTYCRWERRLQEPHPSSLSLLCDAFGVNNPKDLGF